jgi:hydrogenase maturation protease
VSHKVERVLVAGIGNVLRRDDGFGPAVVQAIEASGNIPKQVHTLEMGIGGMDLVFELMNGYDALILIDAVDRGKPPGSLFILEPQVMEAAKVPALEAWQWSAETCQTLPNKALIMAQAAGALPPIVRIVGCQPGETEELSTELSPPVQKAVDLAVEEVLTMVQILLEGNNGRSPG